MKQVSLSDFSFETPSAVCLACGQPGLEDWKKSVDQVFAVGGFAHSKCPHCGTVFTNPRPEREALGRFYSTVEGQDDQAIVSASLRYYTDPGRKAAREADYLTPLLARRQSGKLLDFGCGAGWFAAMARDAGFEAHGIEQMPAAVEAANRELGLETVIVGDEAAIPTEPTYDVIVCNNLIEHVLDPASFADTVFRALKPGGLWMANFPSADAAMFELFEEHDYYFMTPYHLTHFTRQGMLDMVNRAGFRGASFAYQDEAFYWARGLVSQLGLTDAYERWRDDPDFVKFDIALDGLLGKLALKSGGALNEICFAEKP